MSLPEALERAATALSEDADVIRPANGDSNQLLATLDPVAAVRVLTWMLANEPVACEELVTDWCEDNRGVEPLQGVDEGALPKKGRKLLRKAMHRMRTSGVEIEAPATANPVVSRLDSVTDEIAGAYMTTVDPRGSYMVFLVEGHPSGGARLFQVLLDEIRGVVEFDVYATNRSKVRGFLRRLTGSKSTGAVEVDSDIVRGLIRRIAAIHPQDRSLPRAFSEWRRKLEAGGAEISPGERLLEVAGTEFDPARLSDAETSAACHRTAERVRASSLGPWPPSPALLARTTEKLGAEIDAVLDLQGDDGTTALESALSRATEEMFSGDHGIRTASRLEASAYVSWRAERRDEARDLMAAAAAFRAGRTEQNSVARAMLEVCAASELKRVDDDSKEGNDDSTEESEA